MLVLMGRILTRCDVGMLKEKLLHFRLFFIAIVFLAVFLSLVPLQADAALKARSGEHSEYSRLVFDWGKSVSYELQKEAAGKISLQFQAGTDGKTLSLKADNIKSVDVVSQNPLTLSIMISNKSKVRDFVIGNRIIIDVFNPEGSPPKKLSSKAAGSSAQGKQGKDDKKAGNSSSDTKKTSVSELKAKDQKQTKAKPKNSSKTAEALEKVKALKPEVVEVEELLAPEPSALKSALQSEANLIDPHVITVTSTQEVGVAAFESYGRTWLVTDADQNFLRPKINGPTPDIFSKFEEAKLEGGRAFFTFVPEGLKAKGEGGGLLWRLVVSPQKTKKKPVDFKRISKEGKMRGGKLVWEAESALDILDLEDPITGQILKVVTVAQAKDFAGASARFVDFEVLDSYIGLVIRPLVDDLEIKITKKGVEIGRPGGLAIMHEKNILMAHARDYTASKKKKGKSGKTQPRIYSFSEWQMGGLHSINENRNVIFSDIAASREGKQLEDLIMLSKMYLSNGRGAEALGFLGFAERQVPELVSNPEFLSLRGVAHAIDWKTLDAFRDLSIKELEPFIDVQFWRSYVLADLGDWQQAYDVMPEDLSPLLDVPNALKDRLALVLAEISLRAGDIERAERFLAMVEPHSKKLTPPFKAALQYLKGEAERQLGNIDVALALWGPLVGGEDELYHVKAGLAVTRLQQQEGSISMDRAIDNLERLRFAWRGDQLEASVNYWLGQAYFEAGEYVKGLNIMRESTSLPSGKAFRENVAHQMTESFADIFLGNRLEKLSPLDAVAIYEQFSELAPAGSRGDKMVEMLAEHLVKADLLDRAAKLLDHQIKHRLEGEEAARIALRTGAIRLMHKEPLKALRNLSKSEQLYKSLASEDEGYDNKLHMIDLLRAKAYSQNDRADEALDLLNDKVLTPDVNRLRADIAWSAGYWDDAAEALDDIIRDERISLTRPLTQEHSILILNRAVSLNLAGDRIALADMRERYSDALAQTKQASIFDVVTRPRQNVTLADRETLKNIVAEVDLFKDFLNDSGTEQMPSN